MKAFEKKAVISFIIIVVAIYLAGMFTFEMYTSKNSGLVFWCCLISIFPVSLYYSIRTTNAEGRVWWHYITTFIASYLLLLFLTYFTLLKADMLISSVFTPSSTQTILVKSVKKAYVKGSFDHTKVVVHYDDKDITFETSRTNFFLLEHKKYITSVIGISYTGNYYVTKFNHSSVEQWNASKAYLKNWFYRNWWFWAFILLFILTIVISAKYFPNLGTKVRRKPFSLARTVVIWLVIMTGIFVLAIAGIYLYGFYHLINKN